MKFEIFRSWSKQKLEQLNYQFKELTLRKGAYLYKEQDKVDGVYFLVTG